jgi:hypothetical protein
VQLEQIQELQAKLDEERERLRLLQQTLERIPQMSYEPMTSGSHVLG